MSKLDFSEMFQMKPLWDITNETFMRYHQWNIYEISGSNWIICYNFYNEADIS